MPDLIPEGKTRLLLVEGVDDEDFFSRFATHLASTSANALRVSEYMIFQYGGRTNLTNILRELRKAGNFKYITHLGVVRDSDFGTDAFRSVRDRIRTVNNDGPPQIPVPDHPILPSGGRPSVSVLVVPSADREGMLDDLVVDALKADPISKCVDNYFECLSESDVLVVPERKTKARIRVFLIAKNVDRATEVSGITDRLFLSNVYETEMWKEKNLWESAALSEAKDFLHQLLAD